MYNKIILIGRLTKDVDVKMTTSGIEVATFNIAIQRDYKNKNNEYETDFFNCVAYKGTAKFLGQYSYKGQLICVEGKLQNRSYESNGQKRYITEIIASDVKVLEWKKEDNPKSDVEKKADEFFNTKWLEDITDDMLPF